MISTEFKALPGPCKVKKNSSLTTVSTEPSMISVNGKKARHATIKINVMDTVLRVTQQQQRLTDRPTWGRYLQQPNPQEKK